MTDLLKIKEKVKERYAKIALTGESCCGPSVGIESGGGCCSGNDNTVLQPYQPAAQVAELVGYDTKEHQSLERDVELLQSLLLLLRVIRSLI